MRRTAVMIVATCLALTLAPSSLMALCLPSTLEQKIGWSELIFVGTVLGHAQSGHIQVRGPNPEIGAFRTRNPHPPITRYVFGHIRYIKVPESHSQTADTLDLIQPGNSTLWVEDQPEFETGKRYVVLAVRDTFYLPAPYPLHYTAMGCVYPYPLLLAPGDTTEAQFADTLRAIVQRITRRQSPPPK